jgi:hypothetical protein
MKLTTDDILQKGDILHFTDGDTVKIDELAGIRVGCFDNFADFDYVERPEYISLPSSSGTRR